MSNKDLAEMIDIAFGILIVFSSILWFWLYLKLDKIYDELKEIRKEKKEVKHGEWVDKGSLSCRCSNCGCKSSKESKFCPECGADMRGELK